MLFFMILYVISRIKQYIDILLLKIITKRYKIFIASVKKKIKNKYKLLLHES